MLPFRIELKAGESPYRQLIYSVKKALVSGRLKPGDPFPSVRKLSQEVKINPNTAHKAVAALVVEGLLEVRPGIGTVVKAAPPSTAAERRELLSDPLERLVVEAKSLSLDLGDVVEALEDHWRRLAAKPRGPEPDKDQEDTE